MCGSMLFSDMDMCFECMSDLTESGETRPTEESQVIEEAKEVLASAETMLEDEAKSFPEITRIVYPDMSSIVSLDPTESMGDASAATKSRDTRSSKEAERVDNDLFGEFLVAFEGFLGKFIADREIDVQ